MYTLAAGVEFLWVWGVPSFLCAPRASERATLNPSAPPWRLPNPRFTMGFDSQGGGAAHTAGSAVRAQQASPGARGAKLGGGRGASSQRRGSSSSGSFSGSGTQSRRAAPSPFAFSPHISYQDYRM